ncbi:MAG: hypothetical protein H6727_19185 [Myxococcales bacterium]|nr:hypothetical protein [Myxococcales bacterium]
MLRIMLLGLAITGLLAFNACVDPMPEGRGAPSQSYQAPAQRDLGLEIYKYIEQEASYHPTQSKQRVLAVQSMKEDIIVAVNKIVPSELVGDLEAYLRALLPLQDNDMMPSMTRAMSLSMTDAVQDPELLKALYLLLLRVGLSPPLLKGQASILRRAVTFPKIHELMTKGVAWLRARDGLTDNGVSVAPGEDQHLSRLLQSVGDWLSRTNNSKDTKGTSLLADVFLQEDPGLSLQNLGRRCTVRIDLEGNPIPTADAANLTNLPTPFGIRGAEGRGSCGEALTPSGKPVYDTRDLSQSVLGSILADTGSLLIRDLPVKDGKVPFPFNLTVGIRPLLEPYDEQLQAYSDKSPLIRTLRTGFAALLGRDLDKVLQGVAQITRKNESDFAQLLALFDQIAKIADRHTVNVRLESSLFEDILPIFQEIIETPGFLDDLLKALQTPGLTAKIKKAFVQLIEFKGKPKQEDYLAFQSTGNADAIFKDRVDFKAADVEGNRSYFQRVLHLLADVNKFSYVSKLEGPGNVDIPFFEMRIDNLSLFYLRALIGQASIWETIYVNGNPIEDGYIKDQLRLSLPVMGLSETPDAEQLGLFLNRDLVFEDVPLVAGVKLTIKMKPILGREGYELRKWQGDSLLAGLASGLIGKDGGALKPIAEVFAKYNKLERILDLLGVLHRHWGSNANQQKTNDGKFVYPQPRTNLRSIEPVLLDAAKETQLLEHLEKWSGILQKLPISDEPNAPKAISYFQSYIGFLIGKPGTAISSTVAGRLWDDLTEVAKSLDGDAKQTARDAWFGAVNALYDLILQTEGEGPTARFKNRRAPIVLIKMLDFAAKYIDTQKQAGQWGPFVKRTEDSLVELLTDPMIPAALDFFEAFTQDRELLQLSTDLLVHMLPKPEEEPQAFGEILALAAELLTPVPDNIRVPIARYLGRILQTRRELVARTLGFLHASLPLDQKNTLLEIIKNAVVAHPTRDSYNITVFPSLFSTINRFEPGSPAPLNVNDLQNIIQVVANFIETPKDQSAYGLTQFYRIVRMRKGPPKTQ